MTEEARDLFPSPDTDTQEKEKRLDLILAQRPWMSHAFLYDEKGLVFRSQPGLMGDKYFHEEHDHMTESYRLWLGKEGMMQAEGIRKRPRGISFSFGQVKRASGDSYLAGAMFVLPQTSPDRVVLGGVSFEGCYLKGNLFQDILDEMVSQKSTDQGGNRLAMMIYPADMEMGKEINPLAVSPGGWGEGKPEVTRKFDDVFRGLALGIKFQGTSVEALGRTWVHRSFLILACLSLVIVGGLVLTKHS